MKTPDSHDTDKVSLGKPEEVLTGRTAIYSKVPFSSEYINALANGDICVAVGWSGDILQARDRAARG